MSSAPSPHVKAQRNLEVEVSPGVQTGLSEASSSGSRARRGTPATQRSTEIPHFTPFLLSHVPGPRQSDRCSAKGDGEASPVFRPKCILSPKCLATEPKGKPQAARKY